MTKLNESDIIKIFQRKFSNDKKRSEDVEFFKIRNNKVVVKIDTFVQSTDMPPKAKLSEMSRKSIVSCVSDFAAKGVKPQYGIVSITVPRTITAKKIQELSAGLAKAANEFGIKMLGGDTNEGKEIVIQVSLFGITQDMVARKGAKIGDLIFVTGYFGYTSSGLHILLKKKKATKRFLQKATKSLFNPIPKIRFGIKAKKLFSSSMDSSDGLSTTLVEMAKQSKKQFLIKTIPTNHDVIEFASENRLDDTSLVFNGGEEYEIVFTAPKKAKSRLEKIAKNMQINLIEIGQVHSGKGVFLERDNKKKSIKDRGWHHLE